MDTGVLTRRAASALFNSPLYTVYVDVWIADNRGRIVANGRPTQYPDVRAADVSESAWFVRAMATRSGADYVALDVQHMPLRDGKQVAAYATAVRASALRSRQVTRRTRASVGTP